MAAPQTQRKPTFFWQGVLLLLPVMVVVSVGVVLLQRDRMSVRQEAVENARQLAMQIADYIGPRLSDRIEDQYRSIIQVENRNPAPLTMMSQSGLGEFNVPMPQYRRLLNSITNYGIPALNAAEVTHRMILDLNGGLLRPRPYPPTPVPAMDEDSMAPARAMLQKAQAFADEGKFSEALAIFSALATNSHSISSEIGIPLQPLASLQKLRLLAAKDAATFHAAAFELASNAVTWPSLLTPLLLDEAVRAWPESKRGWRACPAAWRQSWWVEEDMRAIYAHLNESGHLSQLADRPAALWTDWKHESWLVMHVDEVSRTNGPQSVESFIGLRFYPQPLVELALLELLDEAKFRTPQYAGVSFEVVGRSLPLRLGSIVLAECPMTLETRGRPDVAEDMVRKKLGRPEVLLSLKSNSVVLAESPMTWTFHGRSEMEQNFHAEFGNLPGLQIRVHLSRPDVLFSLQRQRERLFGGLIVLSLLTAVVGWFAAYRAFRRQMLLSEMKSNFVSSVSHELRAPIASVRLMAENLERGKISGAEKQSEYFRFIVQECRRLSALIENVLDFSRIEQGRKQYEFEPTDLVALTETTVKLMEPYAAERGVRLETSLAAPKSDDGGNIQHSTPNIEMNVDGRAMQQALVNLIDNAVKHSPKGEAVTVGIKNENSMVELSVADRGPGIPAAEREKIFERFYRLGSELRRETQGVGIGLSVVKHIVEAHAGRVVVESEVGQGSRFTIELPGISAKAQRSEDAEKT